jgi:hypothetical protein
VIFDEAAISPLARWENFYVIVGSSAGALTGLQFVVIALIANAQAARSMLEIRAFGTPTVVHFCASLLISAIASAPWGTLSGPGLAFGVCGVAGVIYVCTVIRHARRQTGYEPDAADWMWYAGFPLLGYLLLAIAGALLTARPAASLFMIAATALLLLFVGIHNSWDTVTYITISWFSADREKSKDADKAQS